MILHLVHSCLFLTAAAQKAHENETVNSAKALNDTKKIVVDLKRKLAEQSARISQMETQALQPRGHEMGNIRELEGKLEQAGLQMQVSSFFLLSCLLHRVLQSP